MYFDRRRSAGKRNKLVFWQFECVGEAHGELSMHRDQYFVVLHKGEWKIKHNGRHSQLRDPGRVILIMARILVLMGRF
jgi:hypothetical protein